MRFIIVYIIFILINLSVLGQEQFIVEKLPFSTSLNDEYAPAFLNNNKIVFCSNMKRNAFVSYQDTSAQNRKQVDLYVAELKDSTWRRAQLLSPQLASNMNEGPASITANGKLLCFTRSMTVIRKLGNAKTPNNLLGIFFCDVNNSNVTEPKPFLYNNPAYNVIHPAISADGNELIFASNMPNGFGGYDLYYCAKKNNMWLSPENLGPAINTAADEAFPFFHKSGKLYFASKRSDSNGGFDIYSSQLLNNRWTKAKNIGEPFNSEFDDFGFIINELLTTGYFSSNREGSDDIYSFKPSSSSFDSCQEIAPYDFCYEFYEEGTDANELNSTMLFEWNLGDGTFIRNHKVDHCYNREGTYRITLNVIDSITGEVSYNQAKYDLVVKRPEQGYIIVPDRIATKKDILIDGSLSYFENYKINQYSWDFGDGSMASGMKVKHSFLKKGTYTIKLNLEMTHIQDHINKRVCYFRRITVK